MGLRTWSNVNGTINGTATYYRTGFEWMVENSDEDRIANNRSLVTIRLWISSTSGVGYAWNLGNNTSWKEHDGGNRTNITTQFDFRNISGTGRHYCGYHTSVFPVGSYFSFYVSHNSDGTRSLPVSTYLYGGVSAFQNGSTSTTLTLPAIPRYAAITGFTLNKASAGAGISRLVASWSTDTTCDYVAYSLNGGAWTNSGTSGTSGTFNLNGLTPGTTYTLSLAVKRTDSQLYTYSSSAKSQTTYDIARITAAPNNNVDVDPPFTITYTNPSGASLQTAIYKTDGSTVIASYRGCTSTAYEYLFTAGERTAFYNQTPTTNTLPLRIYLTTSDGLGNTYYNYVERTFEVVNANPAFTTYTIADTNPTTLALTDSDTKIVSGYSSLAATVSVANKAVGIKGATVTQYKLTVGGVIVDTESWSENTNVVLTKTPATSATTTVTAVDGRGNDTSVSVNGTLIEYTDIVVGSISAARQSALAEEVDLVVSGTFWDESFGTVTNSISATYEYRVVGAGSWTAGTTDITPTVVDGAFTISETILGDTALGFDNTKQYEIKVTISDELDTAISTLTIPTSKPWIVLDDRGVGIRTVYDDSIGGALQVGGDTYIDGAVDIDGSLRIPSTEDASLTSTAHPLQIGSTTGANIVMDNNELMARNNGTAGVLALQAEGGSVSVGVIRGANLDVKGALTLNDTSDELHIQKEGNDVVKIATSGITFIGPPSDATDKRIVLRPKGVADGSVQTIIAENGSYVNGIKIMTFQTICGSSLGVSIASGTTRYVGSWLASDAYSSAFVLPAGTIKNLRVFTNNGAPGAGQTYYFDIFINNIQSAITCSNTGTTTNYTQDLTHTATVNAGDRVSLRCAWTATAAANIVAYSFEFNPS